MPSRVRDFYDRRRKQRKAEAEKAATAQYGRKPRTVAERKLLSKAVQRRVKNGTITVGPCADAHLGPCEGSIEAHHEDYSKPWDVTWLCKRHHTKRHRGLMGARRKVR